MIQEYALIILITVIVLAVIEYVVCCRTARTWLRLLPGLWPLLWAVLAAATYIFRLAEGGWLDLSAFFAFMMAVYAVISVCGISAGYLGYRFRDKTKDLCSAEDHERNDEQKGEQP